MQGTGPIRGRRRLLGEINVVPYIDVMLVLLIIFMITAPLLTQGIKVDLPKAAAEPLADVAHGAEPLVVSINARGDMFLNIGASPTQPLDAMTLQARTTAALRQAPQRAVLVKADQAVRYGRVVAAMVILQKAGASKIGFLTDPPPVPASATAP
jgi:biopolymer transport protein TolR